MANSKISALTSATTPLAGTETLPIVQSSTTKQVSVANLTAGRAVNMSTLGVNVSSIVGTGAIGVPTTSTVGALAGGGLNFIGAGSLGNYSQLNVGAYSASAINYAPVAFGYVATNTSGNNYGDFFVATRSVSTDTAPTVNFKVLSSGDVSAVTGNFVPAVAGKGINFTANTPAAGMTSQLLNWYEEGTWTPTLGGTTTNPTVTYGVQRARYTRVGRLVTVECTLTWSAISGGSGNTTLNGFPYASNSSPGTNGAAAISYFDGFTLSIGRTAIGMLAAAGTTYGQFTCMGSAVSTQYIPVSSLASSGFLVFTLTYSV